MLCMFSISCAIYVKRPHISFIQYERFVKLAVVYYDFWGTKLYPSIGIALPIFDWMVQVIK